MSEENSAHIPVIKDSLCEYQKDAVNKFLLERKNSRRVIKIKQREIECIKKEIDTLNRKIYKYCAHIWERELQYHGPSFEICTICHLYKGTFN